MLRKVSVTWKAASVTWSSEAEIGLSGESGFGIDRKDLLEGTSRSTSPMVGFFASGRRFGGGKMRWTGSSMMR